MAILPVTDAGEIAKAPQENSWPFVSERRSYVDHNIAGRQISYCLGQALIWGRVGARDATPRHAVNSTLHDLSLEAIPSR